MAGITLAIVSVGWAVAGNKIGFLVTMFCALCTAFGELIDRGLKK